MAVDQNNNNNTDSLSGADLPEVQRELSKVSVSFNKNIAIVVVICAILIYIFYTLFVSTKKEEIPETKIPSNIVKPVTDVDDIIPEIPKLPDPPKLERPIVSPPPPPPPPVVEVPPVLPPIAVEGNKDKTLQLPPVSLPTTSGTLVESDAEKQRREAKRKSAIVLVGGVAPKKTPEQMTEAVTFKDRGDMFLLLGRGKLIDAVLETGINSDLGGEIRAIISRDVFSEKGKVILIPKGSKIFGKYATSTSSDSYGRVSIIWDRVDLTNGYTIEFDSPAVDNLGRPGLQGRVDNKYKEQFANAVLQSGFNIGLAKILDKLVPPPIDSQAAATNSATATQILNVAQTISSNTAMDVNTRIVTICTNILAAITDKTSIAYATMTQACTTAQNASSAHTSEQRLQTLIQAVNTAASNLLTTTSIASTPTQAQQASTQAFTDVTNVVQNMITQQHFKPTTTVNQGTPIRIYVNKDYKFPKTVLLKSKVMK
ncbi:TraB/TrbI/VirB10 family type IV secretion system protein [Rickettsia prowazekii]|uniref:VIRB10 PROTEIN (VirB10) n=2 Tax=Rickettsia prowazekii TaxID=782 RepID=Q9ZDN6_RICPR|nr:TrbI/VirB10 family protein [Rickettsia prowazekii]EOB09646.1 VirB10 protein [Rickettsia prowazekii str. GvF12]ADE29804.1 VirB10 [Rickettsia prowazekii str. Rp22]AFE49108.1 VIRB10 protein (virB10) [Rickettsia prowazekii str. Chernikova]AFE49954.1 VIRB10 protein (virB10) [Rickettsia prowazekii str. Katsinyian]AFE50798.1 VIRB10 protein (virB10) [Rickettsia prowazekii str. BuV67-CWPP]